MKRLASVVLTALLVGLPATRTDAVVQPPWSDTWNPAPCATGAITEHSVHWSGEGRPIVQVAGWIRSCVPPAMLTPWQFTVMVYSAEAHPGRLRPYLAADQTAFQASLDFRLEQSFGR